MAPADLRVLPTADDPFEVDLREIDAAIELVRRGAAARVRLVGVPTFEELAALGLARAQAAGVAFEVRRDASTWLLTFGPTD
jgi:hypothetical protein